MSYSPYQMRTALIQQFESIKKTLSTNVDTIGMLIEQANSLSQIAENLNGAGTVNDDTKQKLKEEIDKIQTSIATLIKQTETLFQLYEQVADAISNHKQ